MVEYASKDVASLFDLRDKLLARALLVLPGQEKKLAQLSEAAASEFRSLPCHEVVAVPERKRGCVIGKGGAGIAAIERRTGAFFSCQFGAGFLVLAKDTATLLKARTAVNDSYY
jgi:polyribonucleotide nucleotidyltransferase